MSTKHIFLIVCLFSIGTMETNASSKQKLNEELINAIKNNQIEEVKKALKAGADIAARTEAGHTPLHIAKSAEMAQLLIENKANIEAIIRPYGNTIDGIKITPLLLAVVKNNPEFVKVLLDNNANVEGIVNSGETPLWIATKTLYRDHQYRDYILPNDTIDTNAKKVIDNKIKIIEMLLDHGANVNFTPLESLSIQSFIDALIHYPELQALAKYYTNLKKLDDEKSFSERRNKSLLNQLLFKLYDQYMNGDKQDLIDILTNHNVPLNLQQRARSLFTDEFLNRIHQEAPARL